MKKRNYIFCLLLILIAACKKNNDAISHDYTCNLNDAPWASNTPTIRQAISGYQFFKFTQIVNDKKNEISFAFPKNSPGIYSIDSGHVEINYAPYQGVVYSGHSGTVIITNNDTINHKIEGDVNAWLVSANAVYLKMDKGHFSFSY